MSSQPHVPAVDYTSVKVMAGGDSESCENHDFFNAKNPHLKQPLIFIRLLFSYLCVLADIFQIRSVKHEKTFISKMTLLTMRG